jgi:uncharacterized protein (TIGR02265 family)
MKVLEAGQQLDRYTIEALVGEGGMGRVYRAFDQRLHRHVALKVLRVVEGDPEVGVADVLREARAAAAITHPNATAVFDVGELDGRSFIAMEYVPGTSLRRFIGAPLVAMETRLRWLVDIAGALAAAHQVGVIHRDIKPENVMVREDGLVKVLDFGVAGRARLLDQSNGSGPAGMMLTPSNGNAVGTPAYMAPEQLRGVAIDGRADQFGWAVLAYELLTGRLPWKEASDFMRYLVAVLTEQVDPPRSLVPRIPLAVDAAILRALSKSPSDRFAKMTGVAAAIAPHAGASIPPAPFPLLSITMMSDEDSAATDTSAPTVDVALLLAELHTPISLRGLPMMVTPMRVPTPHATPLWGRAGGPDLGPIVDPAARSTFASRFATPAASRAVHAPVVELRSPRFNAPVDLDEHIRRVPSGATIKGMFFLELQRIAEEAALWPTVVRAAGLHEKRYFAFRDYSLVDMLRLTLASAAHVHSRVPLGEGLRRLGQGAFEVVMGSQIGRAIFGVLGREVEPLFLRGPKAFKLLLGVGEVTSEKIAHRTFRFHARNLPGFLETYQVGVVEGVLRHCGEKARVLIAVQDVANAILEVQLV